jgi:DNA-binding PadR family transcriptional regulator
MYGYEIKHIIEDHMGDWTDIKFGSIYFALSKLAEERSVEIIEETRKGNRPSRIVYQITERGRHEFSRLLRELWAEDDNTLYSFDIGVFFMYSLSKSEVKELLNQRIMKMQQKIAYLDQHKVEQEKNPHIPPLASAIILHSQLHLNTELTWLHELKENLDRYY